jgi:glycosyltransferase involved in cell wall biosynthesis
MPELSVIMPVRNGATTVQAAVTSTLRAMPTDSEIVVFDDGSTDATSAALDTIDDPRLRRLRSATSGGITAALNAAIAATDSRFVARMDADDISLPGRFLYQLAAMRRGLDVSFTTVLPWQPGRARIPAAVPAPISRAAFPFHLLLTNPVSHPTMVARRRVLAAVGGYRAVPAEDLDLWIRLANDGRSMARLALPTLLYRIHPGQVTASSDWRLASWSDESVSRVYQLLSASMLGRPFLRMTTMASSLDLTDDAFEHTLRDFARSFDAAVQPLSVAERYQLSRKLRERQEAARRVRESMHPGRPRQRW